MFVNHLNHQTSPYLLQHVNNPVDWYPWGREAFEKAVSENKPILLSIGYSTCHWCHVMAHESFENEDIAKIINAHFISIKVDREERPDIDQIYMSATTMITGQGGWPLTAFLTPQGKPFFAGTYFPPYAKWGSSGFVDILNAVVEGWKNQQEEILKSGDSITKSLLEHSQKFVSSSQMPSENLLVLAYRHLSSQFDSQNGGFGGSPKFPMGHQLSFLLRYYKRFKDPKALEMVEMTLFAVSNGGINDQLAGGFHRYSTDAYWHVPHFEKMLYDQGLLAKAYLEAYQITGYKDFMMTAKNTLDYVINYMQDFKGGFYTAEDADSLDVKTNHSSEGAFYVWSEEEIDRILNIDEANIFKFVFGVKSQGNANYDPHGEFINKNILSKVKTLQEVSEALNVSYQVVEENLENSKKKLLKVRDSRPKPSLDNKVLTDWNGLMISVLAQAAVILKDDKYLQAANKAADFILGNSTKDGRLLHSWCHDKAQVDGLLDDYVYFINGLIDLYEISLKENVLKEALKLAENLDKFEDFENGGFYLTEVNSDDLIIRPKEIYDGAMPSGNSLAAYVLIRLYYLTSDQRWLERFEKLFKNFAQTIEQMPSAYSFALTAFDFYLGQHVKISIEGKMDEMIHQETNRIILKYYIPNKTISRVSTEGAFKVNLCLNNKCLPPINDLKEFELMLLQTQE